MKYCKVEVKTDNGIKVKYFKFINDLKLAKHLLRYYSGKVYNWEEISEENIKMVQYIIGKNRFKITEV